MACQCILNKKPRQMAGKDTGHNIAWSSGLNDDDLNDHLVWPQWCTVTVQVLNQQGRGTTTHHEGGR